MNKVYSLLLAGCMIVLSACSDNPLQPLNQQNLDRINDGMTAMQVKAILGQPSDSKSEPIPIVGGTKTTYTYTSKDGDRVVIVLKNDTVQSKEGHFVSPSKK